MCVWGAAPALGTDTGSLARVPRGRGVTLGGRVVLAGSAAWSRCHRVTGCTVTGPRGVLVTGPGEGWGPDGVPAWPRPLGGADEGTGLPQGHCRAVRRCPGSPGSSPGPSPRLRATRLRFVGISHLGPHVSSWQTNRALLCPPGRFRLRKRTVLSARCGPAWVWLGRGWPLLRLRTQLVWRVGRPSHPVRGLSHAREGVSYQRRCVLAILRPRGMCLYLF